MKAITLLVGSGLAAALVAPALITSAPVDTAGFTLGGAIPNDVFMYVAEQHNPEREFLDRYWKEVFDELEQSGIAKDLMALIEPLLNPEQMAEVDRIKERATQLSAGVDWEQLGGGEMVFAERLSPPRRISGGVVAIPDMVWLLRGRGEGAAQNYKGLVAILEAMVDEVEKAVDTDALIVEQSKQLGGKVPVAKLLPKSSGNVVMPLAVALHDDTVIIAVGEQILEDVLNLLAGRGSKKALINEPRFKLAFSKLPPAEDGMVFVDIQNLLKSARVSVDTVLSIVEEPRDVYRNASMSAEAAELNHRALAASRAGDTAQALTLTQQGYKVAPENSLLLYNLACFHALTGNRNEALTWLEKAVDSGFYAPRKIAEDPHLKSLRGDLRYEAARAKAAELAARCCGNDTIVNSSTSGEAHRLTMQAWQAREEKNYTQGLELAKQAYAVAPQDSRVLYCLACFHALLGHENKALDSLEKAVDGGYYCPQHISTDPDLQNIRSHPRYKTTQTKAETMAAELTADRTADKLTLLKRLAARMMDAGGTFDYVATVETTDGHTVQAEAISALAPGAQDKAIYPVFGNRRQLTNFDRYLPKETLSFSVSSGADFGALYEYILDSFESAGPWGKKLLGKWGKVQKQVGVDVKQDILGWIDGDSISVTLENNLGSVWMLKVTDEEVARGKVSSALQFLSTKLSKSVSEITAKNPAFAGLAMLTVHTSPAQREQLEGFQNIHFAMSPQPAVWGIADNYLIFGSSADAAALCLATARGEHPNIRENSRVMSEMIVPAGHFSSVTLTDQRGLGEELAGVVGVVSMATGMAGVALPNPELQPVLSGIAGMMTKLTPVMRKIDFYKSCATRTTFDGQMWGVRSVTHYLSPEERAGSQTH